MKTISYLLLMTPIFLLMSCSGSEIYRGEWKATNSEDEQLIIHFEPKNFTIIAADGKVSVFDYSQHSVHISNGVKTYGIQLGDGRKYELYFPKKDDQSVGIIKDGHDNNMYVISRDEYITAEDIYRLH